LSEISTNTKIACNTISIEIQSLKLLEESLDHNFKKVIELIHQSKGKVVALLRDSKIPKVSFSSSFKDVIYEISEKRLGATVVKKNGVLCGLITDGDIRRVFEKNENISELIAADIMTKNPIKVKEYLLASRSLKLMQAKKINHLVVIREDHNYMGIEHILDFINEELDG
tara:strand:+ start:7091 stop:7600 length:510 start_codon:yes stop_codon:yes gene_type:complete